MSHRCCYFCACCFIAMIASPSFAQVVATWNGTTGNWSDAFRWSTNPNFPNTGQPNQGDTYNVIMNGGQITLDQNIVIQGLSFDQNLITGPGHLTLNGSSTWTTGVMSGTGTTTFNGPLLFNSFSFNQGLNRTFINNS